MRNISKLPKVRVQLIRDRACSASTINVGSPGALVAALGNLALMDREHLIAVLLDARNALLGMETVSVGTLTASLVHPREIFKAAILANAGAVILVHNHPSGASDPSPEDKATTRRIWKAGSIIGIPLLDHIIIAGRGYFSFREKDMLPRNSNWED